jgi:hypothetical protein
MLYYTVTGPTDILVLLLGVHLGPQNLAYLDTFKGTVSRDFLLLVFFMNQFPPSPRVFH